VAGLLGIFLGPLGIHRFYLGYWVIGLLMLVTGGGCGIWSLVDAVLVFFGRVNDADGRTLSP
jgi:TM2 domain-containing membrane protein YozV